MIFTVRFEHPQVGNKGSAVYLNVDATDMADAIKKARADKRFAEAVEEYNHPDSPITDSLFIAYASPTRKAGEFMHFDGDPRL
jgi:hypothetical protein